MVTPRKPKLRRDLQQRGQALILALLLLGAGIGAGLFSYFISTKVTLDSDKTTTDALALAKTALIGRAVRDANIPGSFPCPDQDNNGQLDLGIDYSGNTCTSYIGRLPWKTLGLPDLRDGNGERLWYALSPNFRDNPSVSPLNSDTRGTITVFAADGVTPLTTQAVVVIFAPGAALGVQTRGSANQNVAANYLDTSAGINNAAANGPFVVGRLRDPANPNYNDRVVTVITPEFIPLVEQRVGSELQTTLQTYYNANLYFPFAAAPDDTSGNCAMNVRRGRVPASTTAAPNPPNNTCAGLVAWTLPAWFTANEWHKVMYYSVAADYVFPNLAFNCTSGGCLTVGANTAIPALFFTPGTPLDNTWRTTTLDTTLSHYLEAVSGNAENQDGWGVAWNDIYVTPASAPRDRDRIYALATGSCGNRATALLKLAPCGQPPRLNPACVALATNLGSCACNAAANQLITTPCENTLKPTECQSAITALQTC